MPRSQILCRKKSILFSVELPFFNPGGSFSEDPSIEPARIRLVENRSNLYRLSGSEVISLSIGLHRDYKELVKQLEKGISQSVNSCNLAQKEREAIVEG